MFYDNSPIRKYSELQYLLWCLYIKHSIAFCVLWEGTFKMLLNIIVQILSILDERGQEKGASAKDRQKHRDIHYTLDSTPSKE